MMHNNSLWDLFFLTGDLKYYLELRNSKNQNLVFDIQNNNEFHGTDNDSLR
jgi:hypothetical protein